MPSLSVTAASTTAPTATAYTFYDGLYPGSTTYPSNTAYPGRGSAIPATAYTPTTVTVTGA